MLVQTNETTNSRQAVVVSVKWEAKASLCGKLHTYQRTWERIFTWKARSWYCCFSLGPRAYHHSPRILLTVRLSWLGCRWCTRARWRLLKIMNAFMGRRMWSFSLWLVLEQRTVLDMNLSATFSNRSPVCLHGALTFLSPSLGRALRDCVRLFMGPVEGAGSLATPGENLQFTRTQK